MSQCLVMVSVLKPTQGMLGTGDGVQEEEERLLGGVIPMCFVHRWSVKDSTCPAKGVSKIERGMSQEQ